LRRIVGKNGLHDDYYDDCDDGDDDDDDDIDISVAGAIGQQFLILGKCFEGFAGLPVVIQSQQWGISNHIVNKNNLCSEQYMETYLMY